MKLGIIYLSNKDYKRLNIKIVSHASFFSKRFMADSLYLLTLKMTEKVVKVMNEEKKMVDTAAFFFYLLWSLVF